MRVFTEKGAILGAILISQLIIFSCSSREEGLETAETHPDLLSDIGPSDTITTDTDLNNIKNIRISVRNNFVNLPPDNRTTLVIYKGDESIIPSPENISNVIEWEIERTISLSIRGDEGILAFIDNDGDRALSAGDYFTKMNSNEIEDGGRYVLFITSYVPFERRGDQGLNGNEIQVFNRIRDHLFESKGLSMIITKIENDYLVYSRRGDISFQRITTENGYEYPVKILRGENPINNIDPRALSTLEMELEAGSNPEGTEYTGAGYQPGDKRLSFVEEDHTSYPFAYERIAQIFDDPNSGDIIGMAAPYGDGLYEVGAHGHLDVTQSRAPLIFSGCGIKKGINYNSPVKAVDIAPTVLKALGCKPIIGVNKFNQLSVENYLRRQDGEVIEGILNGETPEYAIIIILDGLSHTELQSALTDSNYDIPNIRSLIQDGVFFDYGHITNYFSVTFPSHTVIATGVYAGHHGIVNNLYYLRESGRVLTLLDLGVGPAKYLREEVETIFEAYHRNFGRYDEKRNKNGKFSASINEPATRGATYATLETLVYDFSSYKYDELPTMDELKEVTSADNTGVNQMIYLFEKEKEKFPIPSLVMINLTTTDSAGHGWGPHGDIMKKVLSQTDFRVGRILKLYKDRGVFNKTLVVLTADHGMEIQDKNRSFEYQIKGANVSVPSLDNLNIKYIGGLPFIYFITMAYKTDRPFSMGSQDYEISVFDEDRGFAVRDAVVRLSQNETYVECKTDDHGKCHINISLSEGIARLRIEHTSYNYIEEEFTITQ